MKRVRHKKEVKEGPFTSELVLPSEVWGLIILTRFSYNIERASAYRKLLKLGTINHRFYQILYEYVFTSIQYLSPSLYTKAMLPHFRSLKRLEIDDGFCDDDIKSFSHIKELSIGMNAKITDKTLGSFTRLERLDLSRYNTSITAEAVIALPHLHHLAPFGCSIISDHVLKRLSPSLRALHLMEWDTHIHDDGVKSLSCLEKLALHLNSGITDEAIKALPLRKLTLSCNRSITDEGIRGLSLLDTLHLKYYNQITSNGLKHLTALTNLTVIDNSSVNDSVVLALPKLQKVTFFSARGISANCVSRLTQRGVRVHYLR